MCELRLEPGILSDAVNDGSSVNFLEKLIQGKPSFSTCFLTVHFSFVWIKFLEEKDLFAVRHLVKRSLKGQCLYDYFFFVQDSQLASTFRARHGFS